MKSVLYGIIISIHAPREGGDGGKFMKSSRTWDFNPRPPRGGRRKEESMVKTMTIISIHAPREGGDCLQLADDLLQGLISIHAPREGGDYRSGQQLNR